MNETNTNDGNGGAVATCAGLAGGHGFTPGPWKLRKGVGLTGNKLSITIDMDAAIAG